MGSSQDFKSIQDKIQSALVATTRLTNQIAAEDVNFQRTSNPDVEEQLDDTSGRLLALASSLLKSSTKSTDIKAPSIEDSDEIDVQWSRIVDVVDTLLEKADTCLDEYTGVIKRKAAPVEQPGQSSKKFRSTTLENSMRRADITKPQDSFEVKPDNFCTSPWKPILTAKPHALVSLKDSLQTFNDENQKTQYKHPYEAEVLEYEYPDTVFQAREPIQYQPVETTAATFVDTFEGVLDMLEELKSATEIAIDTEHHDFRTYTGLLSLMQISTREKDWIVDTLQPWRRKLEVLNEVFADPKILKVLHGAYMDIIWLQRDCGIYIVGLFDTFEAAVALQYPSRGLAYLLKRFVDFDADKKYQLADWRIRPIPEEMFYYARSDTHYLLYVYDMMRNELLEQSSNGPEQDLIRQVLEKSKETSLRRHETFGYDAESGQGPSGWFNQLIRYSAGKYSKEQFAVFRAVHKWRDEIARREDESTVYIMNMSTLFNIARRMPPDAKALLGLLEPSSAPITKREAFNLSKIINKAKADGVNGPSVLDVIRSNNVSSTIGIGEVAKSVFPQLRKDDAEVLGTQDLVSQTSRLWGKVPMSSRWEEPSTITSSRIVQFELPWAKFVKSSKLIEEAVTREKRPVTEEEDVISLEQPAEVAPPADKEFTLKAGLKRKATYLMSDSDSGEVDDTPSNPEPKPDDSLNAEEIAVPDTDDSDEQRWQNKKSKKAAEKARKRAVKEERRAKKLAKRAQKEAAADAAEVSANDGGEGSDGAPFDYSKAKSVLNATRATNGTPQAPKFNPYGMTAEGPRPARKMHGEKAGKSHTFKR